MNLPEGAIFGVQPVLELLQAGRPVERLLIVRGRLGRSLREVLEVARAAGVPVRLESRQRLDQLTGGGNHQGVIAVAAAGDYADADELLDGLPAPGLVLVVDGVQDPRNLGALLRTAAAAGFQAVFLPQRGAVGLTATVVKASAGFALQVPVARVKNISRFLKKIKEKGLWAVGLEAQGQPVWGTFDYTLPLAVVVGGEGAGLRPLLRRDCDVLVSLPMSGGVESLNVSVAFGVMAYEVVRQRSGKI